MNIIHGSNLHIKNSIFKFLTENEGIERKDAAYQLKQKGYKKSTIYYIYNQYKNNLNIKQHRVPKHNKSEKKKKIVKSLKKNIKNKPYKSYRSLARKVKCDHKTVKKYLKEQGISSKSKKLYLKLLVRKKSSKIPG